MTGKKRTATGNEKHLKRVTTMTMILFITPLFNSTATAQLSFHGEGDEIVSYFNEQKVLEDRGRLHLKLTYSPNEWLFLKASGYGEFLSRSNVEDGSATNFRMHETYLELRGSVIDVRAGYSNVVWGVLDEIQPNDVINPLDISRFFFEGRNAARLPIPLISTRIYFPAGLKAELIAIPFFEKGAFDQLGEDTSPFNISTGQIPSGFARSEILPKKTWREMEFGGRLSCTFRQVDLDFYTFRGREDFPVYTLPSLDIRTFVPVLNGYFPWFTTLGGDMETVVGRWGIRGEGSVVLDDSFQHPVGFEVIEGKSAQVGVGADRKIGNHTINADAVYQRRWADADFIESPEELSLVGGLELTSRYELKKLNVFLVYNPIDKTLFLRWNGGINLLHSFWLELSTGVFIGSGNDLVGRFEDADFFFLKGKYFY